MYIYLLIHDFFNIYGIVIIILFRKKKCFRWPMFYGNPHWVRMVVIQRDHISTLRCENYLYTKNYSYTFDGSLTCPAGEKCLCVTFLNYDQAV